MNVTVGELLGDFILIAGSFILLLVLVKKYAWSNLTSIFEQRAEKIAADLTISLAGKIISQNLDGHAHKELIDQYIDQLGEA